MAHLKHQERGIAKIAQRSKTPRHSERTFSQTNCVRSPVNKKFKIVLKYPIPTLVAFTWITHAAGPLTLAVFRPLYHIS